MTKAEIIAELRRSAVDGRSAYSLETDAFHAALCMRDCDEGIFDYRLPDKWRTFYLLVACALESE